MIRANYPFLVLLIGCLISSQVSATAIGSLKSFVHDTRTVQANFSQTLYDKSARTLQESKGTMQFERP